MHGQKVNIQGMQNAVTLKHFFGTIMFLSDKGKMSVDLAQES